MWQENITCQIYKWAKSLPIKSICPRNLWPANWPSLQAAKTFAWQISTDDSVKTLLQVITNHVNHSEAIFYMKFQTNFSPTKFCHIAITSLILKLIREELESRFNHNFALTLILTLVTVTFKPKGKTKLKTDLSVSLIYLQPE